jgi:hypothetical protein
MYQPWATGRHLLQKFTIKGITYSCCFQAMKDEKPWQWWNWLGVGDWTIAHPEIVIDMANATMSDNNPPAGMTAEQYVKIRVDMMNKYLLDYFKGVVPVTWGEQIESVLQNLSISTTGGIPQVVMPSGRDWGANPAMNKWMVDRTGYPGDFNSGKFPAWCSANGWSVEALITEYNGL